MIQRALLLSLWASARALKVVVAGATGKVGRELVRVLQRQGVPHVALTRDILAAKRLLGVATPSVPSTTPESSESEKSDEEPSTRMFRLF